MDKEQEYAFRDCLTNGNYLGAWAVVKEHVHDPDLRAIHAGTIAGACVEELERSARDRNTEKEAWLRANLAWMLRDFPGLSALYREQLRERRADDGLAATLGDGIRTAVRDVQDIVEGRARVDEKLRDHAERTQARVNEAMQDAGGIPGMLQGLQKGFNGLGEAMQSFLSVPPANPGTASPEKGSGTPEGEARREGRKIPIDREN